MKRQPIRLEPVDYMTLMLGALLNGGVGHSAYTCISTVEGERITIPGCAQGMVGVMGATVDTDLEGSEFRRRLFRAGLTTYENDTAVRQYLGRLSSTQRKRRDGRMPWELYRRALRIEMVEP